MEIKELDASPREPSLAQGNSWLHTWEPRIKLVTCFFMVLGTISLKTPLLLLGYSCFLLMLILSTGKAAGNFLRKVRLPLPFLLCMTLPLLLGGGLPPNQERIRLASLLVLKGVNALLLMVMLFFSQPAPALFNGLGHMGLPEPLVTILFLSWRYVFLFWDKLKEVHRALKSRLFQPSFRLTSYRVYGQILGGMLIKSVDGSERIYRAMVSRGFQGGLPTGPAQPIHGKDIVKAFLLGSSLVLVHIIERGYF